jgi:hypothetical protein
MMKRRSKFALLGLLAVVLLMQVPQTDHSNPPTLADLQAPAEVTAVLHQSCYDCHSNQTNWPWYSYVNPVGWLVGRDVHEGREHLNFSEWESLDARKRYHMKAEILEVIESGEMPMSIYLIMHGDAALTQKDKNILETWVTLSEKE